MANILYHNFFAEVMKGNVDLDSASTVIRVLLERSTSTYTPNRDHDFLDDFTTGGGVELSVASYSRKTVANKAVNTDNTNDRIEWDFDDISFGALESGQTIDALIFYVQTGGDDTTPGNDILIAYIDTVSGSPALPILTNGGTISFTVNAEGFIQSLQG